MMEEQTDISPKSLSGELQERLWIDARQAELENLLRTNHNKSSQELGTLVISYISELTNAIRGLFFQIDNDAETFQLISGYAHRVSKENAPVLSFGSGLVGQAILSNKQIHIKNIPASQLQIRLNAGEAIQPAELLILPLEFNGKVYAAIELLFAGKIEAKLLKMLDYFQGSIAATMENVSSQEKMQKLLQSYEEQTNMLMTQEEELRQNLEEMEAIQQSMRAAQGELMRQKGLVDSLINGFNATLFIVDPDNKVLLCNQIATDFYESQGIELKVNSNLSKILGEEDQERLLPRIADAIQHNPSKIEYSYQNPESNVTFWYSAYFFPIVSDGEDTIGAGVEIRDITDLRMQEEMMMSLNDEMTGKAEELYHINQEFEAQNQKLEHAFVQLAQQNERITDSIRYAKTIQAAILPTKKQMQQTFSELFVIYEAKDIVSGDFYWFACFGSISFVAVADCTGHGVPGALKAMMSNTLLDEAIKGRQILEPAQILDFIQKSFLDHLAQKMDDSQHIDGLSISLCKIEEISNSDRINITFSGSKSQFVYWTQKEKELVRMKGDSIQIGDHRHIDRSFTQQSFEVKKGDMIYLYSDGYVDAGDAEGKKIGTATFLEILGNCVLQPIKEQKKLLNTHLENHIGNHELRDDVTLLGLKL